MSLPANNTPPAQPAPRATPGPRTAAPQTSTLRAIAAHLETKLVGQRRLRETLLIGLLTEGHVLMESVPGLAKTTAAQGLASAVDGQFSRIQCTPDLLPSDIVGAEVLRNGVFEVRLGPVHANIVLLDEINRSSAKTQSAMLEAMQERQTTIGGETFPLPQPFFVLATQNPLDHEGTHTLPEAQLDRFMLKDTLGYPSVDEELEVLRRLDAPKGSQAPAACNLDDVRALQSAVRRTYIDPSISKYIVALVSATRTPAQRLGKLAGFIDCGASPRASIAFTQASKALAFLRGREYVIPEDVVDLAHRVLQHRIILTFSAVAEGVSTSTIIDAVLGAVRAP